MGLVSGSNVVLLKNRKRENVSRYYDIQDLQKEDNLNNMVIVRAENEAHALLVYLHESGKSAQELGWIENPPKVTLAANPIWRGYDSFNNITADGSRHCRGGETLRIVDARQYFKGPRPKKYRIVFENNKFVYSPEK